MNSTARIPTEVAAFLRRILGEKVAAAFVYGSVASGTDRPGSDIDCLTILTARLRPAVERRVRTGFCDLQRQLGYRPDPDYPIELFTMAACQTAIGGPQAANALRQAATVGRLDESLAAHDHVEVLRCLLGARLVAIDGPDLHTLTRHAQTLVPTILGPLDEDGKTRVLRALGCRLRQAS